MSTPWDAAIAPTVSPATTVYELGSPAGPGTGAGAGSGAGAGAGAGAGSGAAGAGASDAGAGAASAAGAAPLAATAATASSPSGVLGGAGAAVSATWAAGVVPPLSKAGGAARAPTPTAATTTAVAMPAHNLLLITGRPVLRSVRGSSVAKLLLVPSGEVDVFGFMGCPSGVGPARACEARRDWTERDVIAPPGPGNRRNRWRYRLEASAHPENAELRVKEGLPEATRGTCQCVLVLGTPSLGIVPRGGHQ